MVAETLPRIHVNVRAYPADSACAIVEASTDGAPWSTQYVCDGDAGRTAREEAERIARVMRHTLRYAGRHVRTTSYGSELF